MWKKGGFIDRGNPVSQELRLYPAAWIMFSCNFILSNGRAMFLYCGFCGKVVRVDIGHKAQAFETTVFG